MEDFLIKIGTFKFKHILIEGYNLQEGKANIADEVYMADGTRRRQYDNFEDTYIEATLSDMSETELKAYLDVLRASKELEVIYFSFAENQYKTKVFFVEIPNIKMMTCANGKIRVMPFTLRFDFSREVET